MIQKFSDDSYRGYFLFTVGIALSIFLAFGCLFAEAHERAWLPGAGHFEAVSKASTCAVIRVMESRLRGRIDETRKLLGVQKDALKKRRTELETCGKSHGVKNPDDDETLLAEICPDAYDSWLSPSYRFHMLSQDLSDARNSLEQAQSHLQDRCATLPKKPLSPVLGQFVVEHP